MSPEGAKECSPGREPWVYDVPQNAMVQPRRGEREQLHAGSLSPLWGSKTAAPFPRACALGYILSPLRGLKGESNVPWLRPSWPQTESPRVSQVLCGGHEQPVPVSLGSATPGRGDRKRSDSEAFHLFPAKPGLSSRACCAW